VFEYLDNDDKAMLLRAMAQDDVAALLNNMAPDDRTMFLEELPAAATRQLLTLLTPEQRVVASTLLGYPEESIGRLMTPHYVAVREAWTVREVLDHIREHGEDSETLNVVYVVDAQGALVDDIRIREFLLTSLDRRVSDLMDRRFVALTATDDQQAAVAVFRQYDRSALPVTDTAGMLIGIVTIDDVLDVAEASASVPAAKRMKPAPAAAGRHHGCVSTRPSTMPAHRNASHGSSGWVPFTNTSNSSPRGVRPPGDVSQLVSCPSSSRSYTHQWISQPASPAPAPTVVTQRLRSVNSRAATTNIAP